MTPGPAEEFLRPTWNGVDDYFADRLLSPDPVLAAVLDANRAAGLPAIDVSPLQGRMLTVLALATGSRRVLELGTLGGYSTVCLARGVADRHAARVVTCEFSPHHAEVAAANFARAGLAHLIDLHVGPAAATLDRLIAARTDPFDLIFIDADKPAYPGYLLQCLKLSRPGTLVIADNVVRRGEVVDAASPDESVKGVRRFTDLLAAQPGVVSTAIQTVGAKGYDGFALATVVRPPSP